MQYRPSPVASAAAARPPFDAVVLAGGAAVRLGGADKPSVRVGGHALLDIVLAACTGARRTVVVGPRRPTARAVTWAREDPPGGGPVAALAAALPPTDAGMLVVLAADHPFLSAAVVEALLDAQRGAPDADGAVLLDGAGRRQFLVAAYRRTSLDARLRAVGAPTGVAVRALVAGLNLVEVPAETAVGGGDPAFDCDTWEDVDRARALLGAAGGEPNPPRAE